MIPYGRQSIDDDDIRAVTEALRSDWLTTGPKVREFEAALAGYCGARHAVTFANGSMALQGAYFAAGLGPGDEFVTTPLTFAATAYAGLWQGARPLFADVDAETGNLDPKAAEAAVTAKTRAVVPVDFGGRPVDLTAFKALARRKNLVLIEDACHSLGASFDGRKIGSLADMTVFSFHPVKSITSGEGGAVLTDDEGFAARLSSFRLHGVTERTDDWRYGITHLGVNSRLTDIHCALGISQMKKLDRFIARREDIAAAYSRDFSGLDSLRLPPESAPGECAWHLYPVRLRLEKLSLSREDVFRRLREAGIGVQVHYVPIHHHPLFSRMGYAPESCPTALRFYDAELSLPIFPGLSEEDRRKVVAAVVQILSGAVRK